MKQKLTDFDDALFEGVLLGVPELPSLDLFLLGAFFAETDVDERLGEVGDVRKRRRRHELQRQTVILTCQRGERKERWG